MFVSSFKIYIHEAMTFLVFFVETVKTAGGVAMNTVMDLSDFLVFIQNKRNVNVFVDMGNKRQKLLVPRS
jgi:hypothetical protein